MPAFDYTISAVPIRPDIPAAHRAFWHRLAGPGSWFSGAERVAIAAESRRALDCPLCAARRQALSPNAVAGEHRHGVALPGVVVDAVHRIVTDQGRITRRQRRRGNDLDDDGALSLGLALEDAAA